MKPRSQATCSAFCDLFRLMSLSCRLNPLGAFVPIMSSGDETEDYNPVVPEVPLSVTAYFNASLPSTQLINFNVRDYLMHISLDGLAYLDAKRFRSDGGIRLPLLLVNSPLIWI